MNATLARLRRLLVMVPWLLEHPGVAIDEVAERFSVTPREVADDLDILGYCGLPGYGGGDLIEVSISGGHVVVRMAEYFSRPLALSLREGLALLLAARATRASGLLGAAGEEGSGPLDSAIAKLEEHFGPEAEAPVAMDLEAGGGENLRPLWPAVLDNQVVRIVYRSASKGETTVREVEPWTLRSVDGAWYLQGYCRLAKAARAFRLDRIRQVELTGETAPPGPEDLPPRPAYEPEPDDPLVVLDIEPGAAWICDHIMLASTQPMGGGRLRLTFQAATLAWAADLVLRLGPDVTVVQPAGLSALVGQRARAVLAHYEGPA